MANSAGLIRESIWRDKEFRALTRGAQCTYLELVSQKEIDRAGIQPLQASKWAKGCDEITTDDIWRDLNELQAARFVFFDEDTDELFVRSYMRSTEVVKQPNILKNACRCATLVASEMLRHELAVELRKLRVSVATTTADEIDPGEEFAYPSGTPTEPIANPSETLPEPLNPSGTPLEPPGVREGEGERESFSSAVETFREGSRARADAREATEPPPARCPRHINEPATGACRNCGDYRRANLDWHERQTRRAAEQKSTRRAVIDECNMCDAQGNRNEPSELWELDLPIVKCDHHRPLTLDEWRALDRTPAEAQ